MEIWTPAEEGAADAAPVQWSERDLKRLGFVRWLVQTGRLNETMAPPPPVKRPRQSRSKKGVRP